MLKTLLTRPWLVRRNRRSNEQGLRFWTEGDLRSAEAAFRSAVAGPSAHVPAFSNLGMVLVDLGQRDEGLTFLERAVEANPRHAGTRLNLAIALQSTSRRDQAEGHFREALRLAPDDPNVRANCLRPFMDNCAWDEVAAELDRIRQMSARPGDEWADTIAPYTSLALPLEPELQLRIARRHAARISETAGTPLAVEREPTSGKIRIGYVSTDFRDHATTYLCAGMLEAHDRNRFEVFSYALNPDDGGRYRQRVIDASDTFADLHSHASADIAKRIATDRIDVLIDMKGYTGGSRPEIFALRPAPVRVSFLGYPGSMGAPFIDYLIADRHVIPAGGEVLYDEAVVRMPDSYQPNERWSASEPPPERAQVGLPSEGIVFCCFNKHYKIEPLIFASWMRILEAVPGSILWLIHESNASRDRLRAAAARASIDPTRLVFAGEVPRDEHLSRHRLADIFLDTHFYNAHTTGSDALQAGVPIVTWAGRSFASRVGASLLTTVGLDRLVCESAMDYERTAITLANDRAALQACKAALSTALEKGPLLDSRRYARGLERAYLEMTSKQRAGQPPSAFDVEK